MRVLVEIKNRIQDIFMVYPAVTNALTKFIIAILALIMIRNSVGFNAILSNMIFIIIFAAACAFVPVKLMVVAVAAYCVIQVFSLSVGVGIVTGVICFLMYLLYYRFDSERGHIILIIPLLCMIKLPILIPLVLAVAAPFGSIIGVLCGLVSYYFLHFIHINTAVFQGMVDNGTSEAKTMSLALQNLFANREMISTIVCVIVMFIAAYYIKKIHINNSSYMAVAIGAGTYLALIIICTLLFGTITYSKLLWYVLGTVISCIVAMFISGLAKPLDYKRTELLEFEDEEYVYYVRAVPKAQVARESVRIKRIYSRKKEKH